MQYFRFIFLLSTHLEKNLLYHALLKGRVTFKEL